MFWTLAWDFPNSFPKHFFIRCIICIWNNTIRVLCTAVYHKINICNISVNLISLRWDRFLFVKKFFIYRNSLFTVLKGLLFAVFTKLLFTVHKILSVGLLTFVLFEEQQMDSFITLHIFISFCFGANVDGAFPAGKSSSRFNYLKESIFSLMILSTP